MRRPRFLLTSAFAAVGLSALPAPAQQPRRAAYPLPAASSSASADPSADPMMSNRAARYLLRNGLDYLNYREYDRALNFFRVVEARQGELSDPERQQLRKGIAQAQQGKREAVNGPHVVAHPQGRPTNPPGAFALARPATTARPASNRALAPEPVQLTSGTMLAPEPTAAPTPAPSLSPSSSPNAIVPSEPAPLDLPVVIAAAPTASTDGLELPTLPTAPPEALPDLGSPPPGAAPMPEIAPMPSTTAATPATDPASPLDLPTLDSSAPTPAPSSPVDPVAAPAEATPASIVGDDTPNSRREPALPLEPAPTDQPVSVASAALEAGPAPALAQDPAQPQPQPQPAPEPPPVAEAPAVPSAASTPVGVDPDPSTSPSTNSDPRSESFLTPRHRQEIEKLAQRSSDSPAGDRASAANPTGDPNALTGPNQGSTRLELQRAPSPTEARPIRRIPVPEEIVPLGRRDWNPNRKYWAASGTCHMILYFQDPALERYGQGVEQSLGTRGRYFSYPLDDPKQSNQRNQILQPFYSIGKFCFQVGTLPYKLVVDPPWEAEYDLGYYRPGDKIPKDTLMITPTGIGPPLKGRNY